MKRLRYIGMMALLVLAACSKVAEPEMPGLMPAPEGERVQLTFQVAVPDDGVSTKAMGTNPTIDPDGFYVAVFGGSGFFNEWVKATVVSASQNYDPANTSGAGGTNATVYTISANLTVSDSRLRLHFIANCPTDVRTSPPISGSSDTEEYVLSRIRSKKTDTYNDGYWAKVILPHGIRANGVSTGQGTQVVYEPTAETLAQFPSPIVLVRNFARVFLRNLTPMYNSGGDSHRLVTIKKYALAYAPSEGVIAPILSAPYMSDETGNYLAEEPDASVKVYYEGFYIGYRHESLATNMLSLGTLAYTGISPANQKFEYYPDNDPVDVPVASDFIDWNSDESQNILYVYERTIPSTEHRATRIIILAERIDEYNHSEGDKYYALDIVNPDGVTIPLLRNQTYTVLLKNIEAGSGETDIDNAAKANSATVSGDPQYQSLTNISDGQSSIAASFTEMFYVKPQEDSVMFRYIPTSAGDDDYDPGAVGNELVTVKVGTVNQDTGVFTEQAPATATSAGSLAFDVANDEYRVWISKDNSDNVIQYVRYNNAWVPFSESNPAHANLEKWGMIRYVLNPGIVDTDGYFNQERSQVIHITGTYNNKEMSRNVIIKLSPRQEIRVACLQKYLHAQVGEKETVRIYIPTDLSRSVFPLDFKIEPNGYSLTPDNDVLPVTSGASIDPNNNGPAYYFIKELTQEDYLTLGTTTLEGKTWKYFDCKFKTTVAQNACTVYVANKYFNDDNANDFFTNFYQRLFSSLTLPANMYYGAEVNFSFVLDYEHRNAANTVFWDPVNNLEASVSDQNRVLPMQMQVQLDGLGLKYNADGITPYTGNQTGRLSLIPGTVNKYLLNLTGLDPSNTVNPQFTFVVNGGVGTTARILLSTVNLTDNPDLYVPNDIFGTIQAANFTAAEFTSASQFYETGQTVYLRFVYQNGLIEPVTLTLTGLEYVGTDGRMSGSGNTYTFTPSAVDHSGNILEYTIPLRTTGPDGGVSVSIAGEGYATANVTHQALTGIGLNQTTATLVHNIPARRTLNLTASISPAGLTPAPTVTWTSSNENVATVDGNGVVTALRSGTTTITARAGSKSATCTVTVKRAVTRNGDQTIATNNSSSSFGNGNTLTRDGVTIDVTNVNTRNANYLQIGYRSNGIFAQNYSGTITLSSSTLEDFVVSTVEFTYSENDYAQGEVTVSNANGSYSRSGTTGTWSGVNSGNPTFTMAVRETGIIFVTRYFNQVTNIRVVYTYTELVDYDE